MRRILHIFIGLLLLHGIGFAQKVEFNASAPKVVRVGERFKLTYELNQKPATLNPPSFDAFQVLGGPSYSSSSSMQWVNGKMISSQTIGYTYIVSALKEGQFTISPAIAVIGKEQYKSNPIEIEVVAGNQTKQSSSTSASNQQSNAGEDFPDDNLFLRSYMSKSSVHQGEQVLYTVKLFSKYDLADLGNFENPDFAGFFKQEIDRPAQISLQRENINGQIFLTAVLYQTILIPQQTGKIVLNSASVDAYLRQRVDRSTRSVFDDFFGSSYRTVQQNLKSKAISLNVKPLPDPKPKSFYGAVGQFKFTASVDKQELRANEAITLEIRVNGTGNLKLIEQPEINFPSTFDIYDPQVSTNAKNTTNGVQGSKTFKIVLIPRYPGDFEIDPIEFSYFDPAQGRYKTITSNSFDLKVNKGDGTESGSQVVTGLSKEDVKYIGKDIQFINTDSSKLRKKGNYFFGSRLFNSLYLALLLLFFGIIYLMRQHIKKSSDVRARKMSKAKKVAKKRLSLAREYQKTSNHDKFFEELLHAIWGYLGDKLSISFSELNKDVAESYLMNKNVNRDLIDKLLKLIDDAEFSRYAPASKSDAVVDDTLKQATDLISRIEQELK